MNSLHLVPQAYKQTLSVALPPALVESMLYLSSLADTSIEELIEEAIGYYCQRLRREAVQGLRERWPLTPFNPGQKHH